MDTSVRSSDGTRLTVRRLGAGIPVVLLHGSGGGLHSWQAVADRLADRYELWLLCRRGYAPSDVPAGPNSFPAEVDGPAGRGAAPSRAGGLGRAGALRHQHRTGLVADTLRRFLADHE